MFSVLFEDALSTQTPIGCAIQVKRNDVSVLYSKRLKLGLSLELALE